MRQVHHQILSQLAGHPRTRRGLGLCLAAGMAVGCGPSGAGSRGDHPERGAPVEPKTVVLGRTSGEPLPVVVTTGDGVVALGEGTGLEYARPRAGGYLVVDREKAELRFIDPSGHLTGAVGRPGAGPAEFSDAIGRVLPLVGALAVPDIGNRRIGFVDPLSRSWLGSAPFPESHGQPLLWGSGADGQLASLAIEPAGVVSLSLIRVPDGFTQAALATTVSLRGVVPTAGGLFRGFPILLSSPIGGLVAVAWPMTGRIEGYDDRGGLAEVFHLPAEAGPEISEADRAAIRRIDRASDGGSDGPTEAQSNQAKRLALLLEQIPPEQREQARQHFGGKLGRADAGVARYPLFVDVHVDPVVQWLWLGAPLTAADLDAAPNAVDWNFLRGTARVWRAYDLLGVPTAAVRIPFGIRVTDVHDGRFVGISQDDAGQRRAVVVTLAR